MEKIAKASSSTPKLSTQLPTDPGVFDSEEEFNCISESAISSINGLGHDFLSTQFHSAAICHFCKKKIWLKVAYQCGSCSMICHKKCITKCQSQTSCSIKGTAATKPTGNSPQRNIPNNNSPTNSPENTGSETSSRSQSSPLTGSPQYSKGSSKMCRKNLNTLLSNLATAAQQKRNSMTRSGSSHNLAPPSSSLGPASKSLPPSPHHSPSQSRKSSLQGTPYSWLDTVVLQVDCEDDIAGTLDLMLKFPQNDDALLDLAKEKGKELYVHLDFVERQQKLNSMIDKLQDAMDAEACQRIQLCRDEQNNDSPTKKTKLAFLTAKCDERSQALATLMLLYLSGLQHCTSNPGSEKQTPSPVPTEMSQNEINDSLRNDYSDSSSLKLVPKLEFPISDVSEESPDKDDLDRTYRFGHGISVTAPSPVADLSISEHLNDLYQATDDGGALVIRMPNQVQMGMVTHHSPNRGIRGKSSENAQNIKQDVNHPR